jgi:hypothetical protein
MAKKKPVYTPYMGAGGYHDEEVEEWRKRSANPPLISGSRWGWRAADPYAKPTPGQEEGPPLSPFERLPYHEQVRIRKLTNPRWPETGPVDWSGRNPPQIKQSTTYARTPGPGEAAPPPPSEEKGLHRKSKKILERLMGRAGMEMPEDTQEQGEWYRWFMNKRNLSAAKKLMRKFESEDRERSDRFELLEDALEAKYQGIEPGKTYTRSDLMSKPGKGGRWKIKAEHQDEMFYNPVTGMRMDGGRNEQAALLEVLNRQSATAAMERYALMAEEATVREAEASSGMDLTGNPSLDSIIANRKMQMETEARHDRDHALSLLREARLQETHGALMEDRSRGLAGEEAEVETAKAILEGISAKGGTPDPVIRQILDGVTAGHTPRSMNLALSAALREQDYGRELEAEQRGQDFEWEKIAQAQGIEDDQKIREGAGKARDEMRKFLQGSSAWNIRTELRKKTGGMDLMDPEFDFGSFMSGAEDEEVLRISDTLQDTANMLDEKMGVYEDYFGQAMIMWTQSDLPPELVDRLAGQQEYLKAKVADVQTGFTKMLSEVVQGEEGEEGKKVNRKQLKTTLLMVRELNDELEEAMRGVMLSFANTAGY